MDRQLRKLPEELLRQTEAARGVLDVDDDEIDTMPVDHPRQRGLESAAARLADDVADKQDIQEN